MYSKYLSHQVPQAESQIFADVFLIFLFIYISSVMLTYYPIFLLESSFLYSTIFIIYYSLYLIVKPQLS